MNRILFFVAILSVALMSVGCKSYNHSNSRQMADPTTGGVYTVERNGREVPLYVHDRTREVEQSDGTKVIQTVRWWHTTLDPMAEMLDETGQPMAQPVLVGFDEKPKENIRISAYGNVYEDNSRGHRHRHGNRPSWNSSRPRR